MKDLNLVPKSYYQKKKDKKKKLLKGFLTLIAIMIIAMAFAFPFIIKYNLNKEVKNLSNLQVDISGPAGMRAQLDEINRLSKEREVEADKINNMLSGYKLSMVMEKIETSKPNNLFLINTNYSAEKREEKSISLYGMAQSDTDISEFIVNLKKSNLFKSVVLKSLTKLDNGNCSYTINAQIAGG